MLIDIKNRAAEPAIRELLGYAVFPDPKMLDEAVQTYTDRSDTELWGYELDGEVIGLVGYRPQPDGFLELKHLAVTPEKRGEGYGRGILLELMFMRNPRGLTAETEEDAVGFFRGAGFEVSSLGEVYPGVEQFRCVYLTEPED